MNIPTCYRCPLRFEEGRNSWDRKQACEILKAKSAGVKGLGLSVIKFPCPTRDALFSPGDVVTFTLTVMWGPDGDGRRQKFEGVVMRRKGRKWLVYCGDGDIDRAVINLYPDGMKKTGETKPLCVHCALPIGVERPQMKDGKWLCRTNYAGDDELPCEVVSTDKPVDFVIQIESDEEPF